MLGLVPTAGAVVVFAILCIVRLLFPEAIEVAVFLIISVTFSACVLSVSRYNEQHLQQSAAVDSHRSK